MTLGIDDLQRVSRVALSPELGFVELVELAGLDPSTAFRGAVLRGDMRGEDLSGFDFSDAMLDGCDIRGADLSRTSGLTKEMLSSAIIDGTTILPQCFIGENAKIVISSFK